MKSLQADDERQMMERAHMASYEKYLLLFFVSGKSSHWLIGFVIDIKLV